MRNVNASTQTFFSRGWQSELLNLITEMLTQTRADYEVITLELAVRLDPWPTSKSRFFFSTIHADIGSICSVTVFPGKARDGFSAPGSDGGKWAYGPIDCLPEVADRFLGLLSKEMRRRRKIRVVGEIRTASSRQPFELSISAGAMRLRYLGAIRGNLLWGS